jgi:DNA-nicking Smr family endonuclease
MRRGKLPIDARLDLHGRYQDAAQAELNAFISSCAATGCRTVLVITGKGSVREGGGILRRRLPDWLNQSACRPHVLAFATARPEHGGSGAFYVLLRRRREPRA